MTGALNPAALYCLDLGGSLEQPNGPGSEPTLCHLPHGEVIEVWRLYKLYDGKRHEGMGAIVSTKTPEWLLPVGIGLLVLFLVKSR